MIQRFARVAGAATVSRVLIRRYFRLWKAGVPKPAGIVPA